MCRKRMDAASESAAPVLRHFCSQTHCEDGKEVHEVTIQMHSMEVQQAAIGLKRQVLNDEIELEQLIFDRKAGDEAYQLSGSYRNKTQKEIVQLEKQKRARLALIFERFKVQKLLEVTKLELQYYNERVIMFRERIRIVQQVDIHVVQTQEDADQPPYYHHNEGTRKFMEMISKLQQKDVLEVQKEEEADQPPDAVAIESETATSDAIPEVTKRRRWQKYADEMYVLEMQSHIRSLEKQEMLLSKQLDAINTMCDSNDEGWSPATMSKTEVCNMTLSKSLQNGREEYNALVLNFNEQVRANEQKLHELNEGLKRERENYEMKAVELDTDLLKSQGTREIEEKDAMEMQMKWETSKPRQTWRKKELEIQQEKIVAIELPQKRSTEALYLRDLNMRDEEDAYFREIFSDCGSEEKERLWQKVLSDRQVSREKRQTDLLNVREQIRVLEERVISIGEELDAVNLALAGDDEGRAIIIPYMAVPDPNPSNPNAGFVNS